MKKHCCINNLTRKQKEQAKTLFFIPALIFLCLDFIILLKSSQVLSKLSKALDIYINKNSNHKSCRCKSSNETYQDNDEELDF